MSNSVQSMAQPNLMLQLKKLGQFNHINESFFNESMHFFNQN